MTRLVFVCKEHQEYGGNGWRPENKRGFDPLSGMAVAHDIMEHFPKGTDSTADEIRAFGASIHVRKDYYSEKGRRSVRPSENFAGEIGDMLRKIVYGEVERIRDCPDTRKLRDEYAQQEINHAISELKAWCKSETDGEMDLSTTDERNIRLWLAVGYRDTLRRYRGIAEWEILSTFNEIEESADKALKHAEIGDRLIVSLRRKSRTIIDGADLVANVRHVPGYEFEEGY